jgi:hypothetical protein
MQTAMRLLQVLLHARNLEDARTTLESALRLPGVRERGATSAGGLTPQDRYLFQLLFDDTYYSACCDL